MNTNTTQDPAYNGIAGEKRGAGVVAEPGTTAADAGVGTGIGAKIK